MSKPEILFQGRRFRVERAVQVAPDGAEHVREVVRHPGAVVVLPLLDDGRICFVRNYRASGRHARTGRRPPRNRTSRVGRRNRLSSRPHRTAAYVLHVARHPRRNHAAFRRFAIAGRPDRAGTRRRHSTLPVHLGGSLGHGSSRRNPRRQDFGRTHVLSAIRRISESACGRNPRFKATGRSRPRKTRASRRSLAG